MDKKTLDRLNRLRAMAEDSSSENEAMIAARRLHSLLAKHGISEVDLDSHGDNAMDTSEYEITRKVGGGLWSKIIGSAIAELYFCSFFTQGTGGTGHRGMIVGQKQYRETAATIAKAVTLAVDTEARRSSKVDREKGVDGWAYITSFRNAAAYRIVDRCAKMVADARKGQLPDEDGEGNLPVLASMYDSLLDEARGWAYSKYAIKPGKTKTRNTSAKAFKSGQVFGSSVPLGHEVADQSGDKLALTNRKV